VVDKAAATAAKQVPSKRTGYGILSIQHMTFSRAALAGIKRRNAAKLCTVSHWIRREERTLREEVPAAPADVRGFYVDLDNIKLVHPLVVAVRTVDRSETADGYVHTYRVVDRIPVGPLHLRTNYVARLYVPVAGDVFTEARQFPSVRLSGAVSFEPIAAGTRVVERIRIEAPRLLASMTVGKAVEAHTEMLAGIRRRFEGATA
jgi:hypothetical protein